MFSTSPDGGYRYTSQLQAHVCAMLYLQGLDSKNIKYEGILRLQSGALSYLRSRADWHKLLRINNKAKYRPDV